MSQKKIRRNVFLCLLTIIAVWMAGCGKNEEQDPLNAAMEMPLSLYQYTEINEVSGLRHDSAFFQTMKKTEDGFGILYMDNEGKLLECHTNDGGATWKEQVVAVDFIEGENGIISGGDVNEAGEYAAIIMKLNENNDFDGYQVVFAGGSANCLIAEYNETVNTVRFNEAGDAILISTGYEVEEYGVDGRLIRSYPVAGVMDMCFNGQEILFLTLDAISVYDEASGELVSEDSGFNEYLSEDLQEAYNRSASYDVLNTHEIMRADGNGAVYILLTSGMYRYVVGSAVIECIYSTSDLRTINVKNTLSFVQEGDAFYLLGYLEDDNTLYFLCCSETDEAVEPVENIPREEITVYTLYSQAYLEETIRQFEYEYPGIKINIEVGREEGSNTTITEAVNSLNTQLLAGNGPDIILMDNLNYAAYRNSGMLLELSGLYEEIVEENPECITTILSCYRTEDGEIYAIPSQFGFSVISAPSDSIDSLDSLESLAAYIRNSPCPNPDYGNDLRVYDATGLFQLLYPAYSHRIFGNGETYDRQELENFAFGMKEVWDALMEHTTEDQIREWETLLAEEGEWAHSNTFYMLQGLVDDWNSLGLAGGSLIMQEPEIQLQSGRSIGLYNFTASYEIFVILSMLHDYPHETYDIFAYDGVNTFTPLLIYSINAKSENTDAAEQFIKYMLSTEVQSEIGTGFYDQNWEHKYGMPVNLEGLIIQFNELSGSSLSVAQESEREEYIDLLGSFSVPTYRNAILEEKIRLNLQRYLDDEITLEQYMEEVDNEITLYMEE